MIISRVTILLFLGLSIAICARALQGAELKRISFEVESFYTKHDLFIPEYTTVKRPLMPYQQDTKEQWNYSIKLRNDYLIGNSGLGRTYWLNTVTGASTTSQFRYVGYEFFFLHKFGPGLGVYYHHHSEHGVDIERETYPLQDSIGVVFCLGGGDCD